MGALPHDAAAVDAGRAILRSASSTLGVIWAQAEGGVIGRNGTMPWHVPEDLAYFKAVTWGHPVIMGRRTWESIPERFRPFPGRTNVVLTSDAATSAEVHAAGGIATASPLEALRSAVRAEGGSTVWVVGGGSVYRAFLPLATEARVTRLLESYEAGDTTAPELPNAEWELTHRDPAAGHHTSTPRNSAPIDHVFETWTRTAATPATPTPTSTEEDAA